MRILDPTTAAQTIAVALGRHVLLLHFGPKGDPLDAAPYLRGHEESWQALSDGWAIVLCDTKEECERLFALTVGDDGPTATNAYDGPARVSACTIDTQGCVLDENT